ncbi:MAG: hypothetical protein ACT4TC_05230 [Myxococcaceae bacterium]
MDERTYRALKQKVDAITRPQPALLAYSFMASLFALVAFPVVSIPLYFRYLTLKYCFDDEGVSMGTAFCFDERCMRGVRDGTARLSAGDQLLTEIRDELRAAARALSGGGA